MGKKVKSTLRKLAISSSAFFDSSLLGDSGNELILIFPEPIKIKTPQQAFELDIKNVASDFRSALAKSNATK